MHNHDNVQTLIDCGAKLNYQRKLDGYSSFHWAARKGDLNMVKLLMDNGANQNLKNEAGQKAVDLAKENNHPEIVTYFKNRKDN